jgi:glycosyltransferase involved in cell wall biosynthesis
MTRKIKILHSKGHLYRGGIEGWLHEVARRLDPEHFEHHVMVWTDAEEPYTADFRSAGVHVHSFPMYKNPARFWNEFNRFVRATGPFDILHTHGTHYHGFVMLVAKLAGIPVRVAHSHSDIRVMLKQSGLPYKVYAAVGNRLLRSLATAGIAVSTPAAEAMFGPSWGNDARWKIQPCGIDLTPFAIAPDLTLRDELGIPAGRFVIGHVGRFEPVKNHQFILDIAEELVPLCDNAHFLLVGDGSLRGQFIRDIENRNLTSRFTLLQDCRTVPKHMISAMDAFVFPSLHEGLGIVSIEAQAAGLPCLMSTNVPAEAAFDCSLGRRLSLDNGAAHWAAALAELPRRASVPDPARRDRFEQSEFNITHSTAKLALFYESLTA